VTEALAGLEEQGIVARARGVLRVIDPDALKARACECYKLIEDRLTAQRRLPHFEHRLTRADAEAICAA
jgi:hypothetical protein